MSINIKKRIDSGNEDHCGPCGQYSLEKKNVPLNLTSNGYSTSVLPGKSKS